VIRNTETNRRQNALRKQQILSLGLVWPGGAAALSFPDWGCGLVLPTVLAEQLPLFLCFLTLFFHIPGDSVSSLITFHWISIDPES
jgi:hypothetical protein